MNMPYPPAHHIDNDQPRLARLVEILRLATVVVADEQDVHVAFIPLLLERRGEHYALLGHLDASNPQAGLLDGRRAKAIFAGPQGYVSPDDYVSSQLPTWNYLNVVAEGEIRERVSLEARRALLLEMSEMFGGASQRFKLAADDARMAALLPGIRAFSIDVDRFTGRFKLSQDKSRQDAQGALRAMRLRAARRTEAVFQWIEEELGQ